MVSRHRPAIAIPYRQHRGQCRLAPLPPRQQQQMRFLGPTWARSANRRCRWSGFAAKGRSTNKESTRPLRWRFAVGEYKEEVGLRRWRLLLAAIRCCPGIIIRRGPGWRLGAPEGSPLALDRPERELGADLEQTAEVFAHPRQRWAPSSKTCDPYPGNDADYLTPSTARREITKPEPSCDQEPIESSSSGSDPSSSSLGSNGLRLVR